MTGAESPDTETETVIEGEAPSLIPGCGCDQSIHGCLPIQLSPTDEGAHDTLLLAEGHLDHTTDRLPSIRGTGVRDDLESLD